MLNKLFNRSDEIIVDGRPCRLSDGIKVVIHRGFHYGFFSSEIAYYFPQTKQWVLKDVYYYSHYKLVSQTHIFDKLYCHHGTKQIKLP